MSRRVKPKIPFEVLTSSEQVDLALQEVAACKRELARIEAELNRKINQARAGAARKSEPVENRLVSLEQAMTAFGEFNRTLFEPRRSVKLRFGTVGFRRSVRLSLAPKTTWKEVLQRLRDKGLTDGIRLKETVNKEVLETWSDEVLASIGCRRKVDDKFWYELKTESLQPEGMPASADTASRSQA